jgi:hypothetical protein
MPNRAVASHTHSQTGLKHFSNQASEKGKMYLKNFKHGHILDENFSFKLCLEKKSSREIVDFAICLNKITGYGRMPYI